VSTSIDLSTPNLNDPGWLDLTEHLGLQILGTIEDHNLRWHFIDVRWSPEQQAQLVAEMAETMRATIAEIQARKATS
jgi:hypothetical protein